MMNAAWRQPSEREFNENWFRPLEALDVSDIRMADESDKWAIVEQLRAGQIIAVARTAQISTSGWIIEPLVLIYPGAWRRMNDDDEERFWKTGHLVVETNETGVYGDPTGRKERYFDVRFDPASFSGKPPPRLPQEGPSSGNSSARERGREISTDDATRFSQAILAGWPDSTETFAHTKALAFFPENKVPRDWFLRIFRSIRGDKKRGRPPKIRE